MLRKIKRRRTVLVLLCAVVVFFKLYFFSRDKAGDLPRQHFMRQNQAKQHTPPSLADRLFNYTRTPYVSVAYPRLLILIFSAPHEKERRAAIRATWGHSTRLATSWAARVFVVGSTSHSEVVDLEQRDYGDILTDGRVVDSYNSLTRKVVSALYWASTQPWQQLRYIAKIDSDNFVNVDVLSHIGEQLSTSKGSQWMAGYVIFGREPIRDIKERWYVSEKEYPRRLYPAYLNGPHYMMTLEAARRVTGDQTLAEVASGRALRMEDVYVTGIVRARLQISLIHESVNLFIPAMANITMFLSSSKMNHVFAVAHSMRNNADYFRLQKKLDDPMVRAIYNRALS